MAVLSRIGLRQLVVLLVLLSLLVAAGNMFWAGSSLYQQALLDNDLHRQQGFARQLADKLGQRLQQGPRAGLLDDLLMDEHQRAWIISPGGQVVLPAGARLAAVQERALALQQHEQTVLLPDDQGVGQMISIAAVPGSDWRLMLQTPSAGQAAVQPAFVDLLVYILPAGCLLLLLAWLAGGSLARPFRLLAACARNLNRPESIAVIGAVQPSSREAAELQSGLLQGARQLDPQSAMPDASSIDPLTGLSTPEILPELVTNIGLGGTSFTALVLAVDDYEQIREHFSEPLRNLALKHLAGLLLQHSRELDISVRMGEEVFLLLLPQCPIVIAQRIAERLRSKIQDSAFEGVGHMTISVGVAAYQPGSSDPLETLKQAQQLLISARREGQNRVHVMPE